MAADSRDQRRVETPPRVLMKNRAAADRAARAAAAAANGEAAGQANSRYAIMKQTLWLHILANYHMLQYVTSDRLDRDEESASVSVCECHNQ